MAFKPEPKTSADTQPAGNWSSSRVTGKKRRVPRRNIKARVGVLHKGRYFVCDALEIGEGGMLFSIFEPILKGDRVVITLRIPDVFQGVAMGSVVYCVEASRIAQANRYGIQFDQIEFDLKRKIRNFVASSTASLKIEADPD